MYGQGNYVLQFRHGSPAPPLPFQVPPPPAPQPPFQPVPPTGAPPPSAQQGPPHSAANQIPQVPPPPTMYHHGLGPSQPVHHQPPGMVNMSESYMHMNPPLTLSNYGNAPTANPYAPQIQAGAPYPPPMGNQSVHHISPPAVPPPRVLPPTGVQSQGQPLYRAPHPPPPGIQHVPTPPPPPPSSFVTVTPAPFVPFVHGSVNEAYPPSLPPPPPPTPPSPPPPIPSPPPPSSEGEDLPIVDSEEMLDHRAMKDHGPDKTVDGPGGATQLTGGILIDSGHHSGNEKVESFPNKEEPPAPLSPPPPRPADEVVHCIEALCKFMANVGPQFENLARTKEAGNPCFSFLFGGEPGSAAAVGYEYFQWMKRKYRLEVGLHNHAEQIMSSQTPSEPLSPIDESKASPAESDMDMDDDAGQPERSQGTAELNKKSSEDAASQHLIEEQFHAPSSITQEGVAGMSVPSCLLSSESSFFNRRRHDGDEFTAHRISSTSPEATPGSLVGNVQQAVGSAFEDATSVDTRSSHADGTNVEVPRVFVNDGSPFRHIQGYASDDSGEDDRKELTIHASSGKVLPCSTRDASHENERTELHSALDSKVVTVTEKSSQLHLDSAEACLQHIPIDDHTVGSLPTSHDVASPATISPGLLRRGSADDFGSHQKDDQTLDRWIGTSEASCHSDLGEADKDSFGRQVGELSREKYATKNSILKVDEFGRMIREGASSSDSEDMPYERRSRRGRSRSRSRSPHQCKRRSRSPWRWRGRRSPSPSWSPKGQSRSKSPPLPRRMGERTRRNHAQPPECIHFLRGRCYRGASCWFLHSDSGRYRNRPQDHRDMSQDSVKYVHGDASHGAKNIVKETAAVQQESFLLEEETQELRAGTELPSDSMKDEVFAREGSLDSIKDDAKHFVSHEQGLSKNIGEVVQELGSHEVLNELQESHHAEPKKEAPDTSLTDSESAQKPLGDSHPPAEATLGGQTSSNSETKHLLDEDHLGQPPPDEVPVDQPQPSFSVPMPQSEPQNVSSPQHLHVGPSISQLSPAQPMQSSDLQSQMPVAQPYIGEIPVTESYPKPSPMSQSFPNQVPGFHHSAPQPSSFAGGDFNVHLSQTQPPPFLEQPPHFASFPQAQLRPSLGHPPHHPSYAPQPPRESWVQTSRTTFLSQPSPADMFPANRPSLPGSYHSLNAPLPKPTWADIPPPSYGKETVMHPIPSVNSNPQFRQNDGHLRSEFPLQTDTRLHHHQVLHSVEEQKHMNEFMQRPLPGGPQQGQTFGGPNLIREEQHYLRHPVTDGHQLASSFQPLLPSNKEEPGPYPGYSIQPQDHRSFLRDDFHASVGGMPYSQPASHGLQRPTSSNFPSNMGETGGIGPSVRNPLNIPGHLSDVVLSKIVVPTHYNPFASTFEQSTTSSKYVSNAFGQEGSTSFGSKYVASFGYDHRLMSGHGPTKVATSPLHAGGADVAFLANPGGPLPSARSQELMDRSYPWQQSVEDIVQKQFKREPLVGDQYDPLFDSIEPSSKMSKKLSSVQEQDSVVHDTDIASSVHVPADVEENNKQKVGPTVAAKIENDEFGETAPDAEVGAVENGSPVPVDGREWSPAIPIDLPDKVMGEIEIDQVRSPGKSKKSKDSRSMKLFKIALADFVKEVLKPSWRQGNMSKEAFKTIVKKTVDKVSGSVSRHQIPKTQAKINQYVESSQRKLTKLVMGYVDKYVKM